jgi:glycosyltransferase involved in cell wall biosynthesis
MSYISIVVPTFKEEKYISKFLTELQRQTDIDKCEIVIADYNPEVGKTSLTKDAASSAPKHILKKVRWVDVFKKGIGYARDIGIKQSIGEYIINMDADSYFLQNDAIHNLIWPLEHMFPQVVLTHCANILEGSEHAELFDIRNAALAYFMWPFVYEPGMTMSRFIYDMSPGFRDIVAGEGFVLGNEIALQHGFPKLLKVDNVDVIVSNRRVKNLQSNGILDVFDYNRAYRGNEYINII